MAILGHFGGADLTQNTVYCLFEPDAEGLTGDGFPTESSIFYGTRPGRRYAFFPRAATMPEDKLFKMMMKTRRVETNGAEPDPEVVRRSMWEYQNVVDGEGLARLMDDLAAKYPDKGDPAERILPAMPDLAQTLNMASADTRGVIVLVHPEGGDPALERQLTSLLFEEGIAGRTHIARLTAAEWAEAKAAEQIAGGEFTAGVVFVAPDPFGLDGEVWAEVPVGTSKADMRTALAEVLDRFHRKWRKLDRVSHIRAGVAADVSWTEYDPDTGGLVRIGAGSKKLGEVPTVH